MTEWRSGLYMMLPKPLCLVLPMCALHPITADLQQPPKPHTLVLLCSVMHKGKYDYVVISISRFRF